MVIPAPAKVNLFLAVTGRRGDGFHELVSVVAPLAWGDELTVETRNAAGGPAPADELIVEEGGEAVPTGEGNLVLKAVREFREATGWGGAARIRLGKRIPVGAGLGGGSSDATAALKGLNERAGKPLGRAAMSEVAARVGSDCALFLREGPVVMRGRGERVDDLPGTAAARLRGRRVLVFKPAFGIATAWSYARLASGAKTAGPAVHVPAGEAEAKLARWIEGGAPAEELLFNNLERPAFEKFPALPLLLERLQREFNVTAGMSGSGSACCALLRDDVAADRMAATIRKAWGNTSFIVETRLL